MALYFDTPGKSIGRTSGVMLDVTQDFTVLIHVLPRKGDQTAPGTYRTFYNLFEGSFSTDIFIGQDSGGVEGMAELYCSNGASNIDVEVNILPNSEWQALAATYNSTSHLFVFYQLVNGVATVMGSDTLDMTGAVTPDQEYIGDDTAGTNMSDTGVGYHRSWQTVLNPTQLAAEMLSPTVIQTGGLFTNLPIVTPTDLADHSGNGHNWSLISGPLSYIPGPFNAGNQGWTRRIGSGGTSVASGTTSITITKPTGTVDGDILVMGLVHKGVGYATMPAGWTAIEQQISGATRVELHWKRASSEGANYTVTGAATTIRGVLNAFGGGSLATNPVSAHTHQVNVGGNASVVASLAIPNPEALLVGLVGAGAANSFSVGLETDDATSDLPTDYAIFRLPLMGQTSGAASSIEMAVVNKLLPGDTGPVRTGFPATIIGENIGLIASFSPERYIPEISSRYYLTTRVPTPFFFSPLQGDWDSTQSSPCAYGGSDAFTYEMARSKTGGGYSPLLTNIVTTRNSPLADICLARWVTPQLDAQTISGTFNLMNETYLHRNDTSSGNPIPTGVYKVHIYVTSGNTLDVRATLLDKYVDTNTWPVETVSILALIGDQTLSTASCLAGDRVVIELGWRQTSDPYPPAVSPPNKYAITNIQYGSTDNSGTIGSITVASLPRPDFVPGDGSVLGQPWFQFSHPFVEQTLSPSPAVNTDCSTSITIPGLPFTSVPVDITNVSVVNKPLWWKFVADQTGVLITHTLGSSADLQIEAFHDCPAMTKYSVLSGSVASVGSSVSMSMFNVTEGDTVYIRVQSGGSRVSAPVMSGEAKLYVCWQQPPADGDVIVTSSGYIARYTKFGLLAALSADFAGIAGTGLAIDYTKRPMEQLAGGTNTSHRLCVALFGERSSDDLIEILDLPTLNLGTQEVDFIAASLPTRVNGTGPNANIEFLTINAAGHLTAGWFGDGFTLAADNQASYQATLSTPTSCQLNFIDATHGDNQPGAPFAANTAVVAQDVAGVNFGELDPTGNILFYTSGGFYRPIGGQTVFRYDLSTSTQLTSLPAIPPTTGPNPGVKGLFPLPLSPTTPDGGCLVCNGTEVVRLNESGGVVQHFVPTSALRSLVLTDVELSSDASTFWVLDENSSSLFKFDISTGTQLVDVWTQLGYGTSTSIVVYRTEPFPRPLPDIPSWQLHRFDLKPRNEERA